MINMAGGLQSDRPQLKKSGGKITMSDLKFGKSVNDCSVWGSTFG